MSDDLNVALEAIVDDGQLGGAAWLVARGGRVVHVGTAGWQDREAAVPVARDTVWRIASMTKPVTAVAAMALYEEGRFELEDPISKWVPELEGMRVLRDPDGPFNDTVPAERAITVEHLLTHRAGITYGSFHNGPIADAYESLGGEIDSPLSPDEWLDRLGSFPLVAQPGGPFTYGRGTDVLGFLLARMEGVDLGEVLRRRVFEPLGMIDTGFVVPADRRHRCARLYGYDDDGALVLRATAGGGSTVAERPDDMTFVGGGAGLWSTLDDYATFARVFAEDGTVDGVRVLDPATVALMRDDRLGEAVRSAATLFGFPVFGTGHTFGLGLAVVIDSDSAAPTLCRGSVGTVGWPGAFGGWWQADAAERTVMVFLTHNIVEAEQVRAGVGVLGRFDAITQLNERALVEPDR